MSVKKSKKPIVKKRKQGDLNETIQKYHNSTGNAKLLLLKLIRRIDPDFKG